MYLKSVLKIACMPFTTRDSDQCSFIGLLALKDLKSVPIRTLQREDKLDTAWIWVA